MKKILPGIAGLLVIIIAMMLIKTATFTSKQVEVAQQDKIAIDRMAVARHLSDAIQIKTISWQDDSKFNPAAFLQLHRYLEKTYPLVHKTMTREKVAGYSLLFTWKGSDPSKKPILLMAHQDVVPIEAGTEGDWTYPGFSGKIADGFVWGRGALDIKNGLVSILDAMENLVRQGFKPERTIYLAFGHDEEIGGKGAAAMSALLEKRGVKLEYVVDEGGAIMEGMVPGVKKPVALIGIAEKGYMTLELTVKGEGGHSSMPPAHTSVGILSKAICAIENNPFSADLKGAAEKMFQYVGPEMSFPLNMIMANLWLLEPVLESQLKGSQATNASLRTTAAATMIKGSDKENVLPQKASAMVNFRIIPGETMDSVTEHVRDAIDDERVRIRRTENSSGPSGVSDVESKEFTAVRATINTLFPDVIVAPYLVLGATDSRHYSNLTDKIFRFIPERMKPEDLERQHGTNERIGIDELADCVRFYMMLVQSTQ